MGFDLHPEVPQVVTGLSERKGVVGGLGVSPVGYLSGWGRQPGNHFARRRAFARMMPRPRPQSRARAAVPQHNNSRGCQQGAANRDTHAFQPQLRVSAPLPSPLCMALPALLRVLFIVISPRQLGRRVGGAGWAQCRREGMGAKPVVPARQGGGKTPSPQPLAAPAAQAGHNPIARHRPSPLPARAGLGGPMAIPPCQEGHNTILPKEPPPQNLPPSAAGSQTPNTHQVLHRPPRVFQQPLAFPVV